MLSREGLVNHTEGYANDSIHSLAAQRIQYILAEWSSQSKVRVALIPAPIRISLVVAEVADPTIVHPAWSAINVVEAPFSASKCVHLDTRSESTCQQSTTHMYCKYPEIRSLMGVFHTPVPGHSKKVPSDTP